MSSPKAFILHLERASSRSANVRLLSARLPIESEVLWAIDGAGEASEVVSGLGLSQPAGVAHNVIARSGDLELIEINMPAEYGTQDLGGARDAARSRHARPRLGAGERQRRQ